MPTWNIDENGDRKIVVVRNGAEEAIVVASNRSAIDAVKEIARAKGLTSIVVKDTEDNEVEEADLRGKALSETGDLYVYAKNQGAGC